MTTDAERLRLIATKLLATSSPLLQQAGNEIVGIAGRVHKARITLDALYAHAGAAELIQTEAVPDPATLAHSLAHSLAHHGMIADGVGHAIAQAPPEHRQYLAASVAARVMSDAIEMSDDKHLALAFIFEMMRPMLFRHGLTVLEYGPVRGPLH